jgi:PAS domain S-box-containing protein
MDDQAKTNAQLREELQALRQQLAQVEQASARQAGVAENGGCDDVTERRQTEQQLLTLQKAVETMHLGVTISDLEGKIVYTNPADAAMHDYTVDELIGRPVRVLAPKELHRPLSIEQIEQTKNWIRESINLRRDGSRFPVQLSSDIVRDAGGRPFAIVTTCEDISERKRTEQILRQERNLLRTLIDNIPDYIFVKDTEGRFLINNRAHAAYLGADTPEQLIGSTVFDYFPTDIAAGYDADDRAVIASGRPVLNRQELAVTPNNTRE